MSTATLSAPLMTPEVVRARAKVLAREHRTMRSELVALRREAGLTQGDVANRMGVTQQAVSKFERYDSDPKLSTVRRYANAVGALVEHRVERDQGQSLVLAAARSDWVPVDAIRFMDVRSQYTQSSLLGAAWSAATSKQTDFALAR
ncbi:helix-turn-helix transcriptional regulator [Pseudarthrobacter sp. BRE9]|uniref:helix-turn-helix domain-containing protein n=1 Tax=Pseudarthrobacter sp. BRE9 TaxID=2962582 RepID=UPI0028828FD6|nr:helix-turn-helix transcriptional regulator [Pseudarthrobacter sp. BRE9]MDT0169458.1 helix-turn-helix transcriptional regulator [Pseudarthrobacter sp. BRE9]